MVFLTSYYVYEKYIAHKLIKLQSGQMNYFDIDHKKATEWVETN